ncbi:MAG: glycoside hydrolase family 3 N-terminal domain-containing protein [Pseudomonadota bacterium]
MTGRITILLFCLASLLACAPDPESADVDSGDTAPAPAPTEPVQDNASALVQAENWPRQAPVFTRSPEQEAFIANLLARMTLEEKVGQVIQADIASVTPDEVREYNLGSVLNGGSSAPGGDNRTTPDQWLALADAFWAASTDTSDGGVGIPAIWGTDAVHGHSNILGATLFPHNIGLGMADDPDLIRRIGEITALEMRVTGLDWTFAPTVAVARNDRWGRTYESYSEDPALVARYAPAIVEGLQGKLGSDEFLRGPHLSATVKHYVGDGGTQEGIDQGNVMVSEAQLRDIHAAGYPPAIRAGVQTVMASFNAFHGRKLHGHRELLNDVLIDRMGFDGMVVGDWNGHGQVADCEPERCVQAMIAGLDLYMAPDSWRELYQNLLVDVQQGNVAEERLDEAVARILRVKLRAGTFDTVAPSQRRYAGQYDLLGAPAHRAVAREAVRKSLVLLKNNNQLLPLAPDAHILLAGDGAHRIGKQAGGWTLNWQGDGNENAHFPNGDSIYDGFAAAVAEAGGRVTLSDNVSFSEKPDVALVVFGEEPYAEFQGDRAHVDYADDDGLKLLRSFRSADIPTVAVFLSGRPLWVNPELNQADAFVAAWLPGSEGAGVADVLIARVDGAPRHDFTGRLAFSWPQRPDQAEVNVGDADYDPLFAFGYGLTYSDQGNLEPLPEDAALSQAGSASGNDWVRYGDPVAPWQLVLKDLAGESLVTSSQGMSPGGRLQARPADDQVQEDTLRLIFSDQASLLLRGPETSLARQVNGQMAVAIQYRVNRFSGTASVTVGGGAPVPVTRRFAADANEPWQDLRIPLSCFTSDHTDLDSVQEPWQLEVTGQLELRLRSIRLAADAQGGSCTP